MIIIWTRKNNRTFIWDGVCHQPNVGVWEKSTSFKALFFNHSSPFHFPAMDKKIWGARRLVAKKNIVEIQMYLEHLFCVEDVLPPAKSSLREKMEKALSLLEDSLGSRCFHVQTFLFGYVIMDFQNGLQMYVITDRVNAYTYQMPSLVEEGVLLPFLRSLNVLNPSIAVLCWSLWPWRRNRILI